MDTIDDEIDALATEVWEAHYSDVAGRAADMLLTMRTKFNALRDYTNGLEARAEAADKSEWDRLRTQDIMTLGSLVYDENGVAWKARVEEAETERDAAFFDKAVEVGKARMAEARAEAAEKALQAMLRHSGVSDMAPEDKFPEDIDAESQAYAALKAKAEKDAT